MQALVNEAKFIELVVHAVNALDGQQRGMATRLNKILYFCDFAHVRRTGDPITGFDYQKLRQGPAPRAFVPIRDRLIEDGTLTMRVSVDELGYSHHIYTSSRQAELSVFDESERDTINAVVAKIAHMSARELSDLSHEDAGWQMTHLGESIPYASAYIGEDVEIPERLLKQVQTAAQEMTSKLGPRLAG